MAETAALLPITKEEFSHRQSALQKALLTMDMDGLLLTTDADWTWVTGFRSEFWQSPTRNWYLFVPASGQPVAIIPTIGEASVRACGLDDVRTFQAPALGMEGVDELAVCLREHRVCRLGLMMGRETHLRMPLGYFERLREDLPGLAFSHATSILQSLRSVKSAPEVARIERACEAASEAFDRLPEWVSAGMDERAVFRQFRQSCLDAGADHAAYLVGGADQGGYGDIIRPPTQRRLHEGDILILDCGCQYEGYFSDFDRNFAIGKPSLAVEDAYKIVWEATEAGLQQARPGMKCSDLFEVMNRVMAPHAVDTHGEVGRLGHGLGLQLTEFPSLAAFDHTEIVPGMVLTLEPGYSFAQGKMMVHEENIVITETGCRLLSQRACENIVRID